MAKKKPVAKKTGEYPWIAASLRPLAVPVQRIKVDPRNARKHDEDNLKSIAASLQKFGQRVPLVVNETTGLIEKGNGTFQAAQQLGRMCYGIEISPGYCGVTLERMKGMGLTPRLVENDAKV